MKTFLISLLTLTLLAAAVFTRPSAASFRDFLTGAQPRVAPSVALPGPAGGGRAGGVGVGGGPAGAGGRRRTARPGRARDGGRLRPPRHPGRGQRCRLPPPGGRGTAAGRRGPGGLQRGARAGVVRLA